MSGLPILAAKRVELDGKVVYKFPCPGCGVMGRADEEQAKGEVSCECPRCGWHENVRLDDEFHYLTNLHGPKRRRAKS